MDEVSSIQFRLILLPKDFDWSDTENNQSAI